MRSAFTALVRVADERGMRNRNWVFAVGGFALAWTVNLGVRETDFNLQQTKVDSAARATERKLASDPLGAVPEVADISDEEAGRLDEEFTREMIAEGARIEEEDGPVEPGTPVGEETARELRALRDEIRAWAPTCSDGSITLHECPFGDALEYMGNLCLSGETKWCDFVKRAQGPDGQFWRTPGQVGVGHTIGADRASFSRDMSRGAWAYIIQTKDTEAAKKWLEFIKSTPGHHLCKKSKTGWDACATRLGFWNFAQEVWEYLELPLYKKKMKGYKFLLERVYDPVEIRFQPKGYPALLTWSSLYAYQELEKRGKVSRNQRLHRKLARYIHKREPENPLYRYLVQGPSEEGAKTILRYCPSEKPDAPADQYGPLYSVDFEGPWDEWVSDKRHRASGYYCILAINLYLGTAN